MGETANNPRNQGGDVDNQCGKLSIAVKITQESNGNDKFKEWRELKINENEHIYKIHFQFYFGLTSQKAFLLLLLNMGR